MDRDTLDWFKRNVTENEMMLDLFINNPFNEFGNLTVREYASQYGWPSVLVILKRIYE